MDTGVDNLWFTCTKSLGRVVIFASFQSNKLSSRMNSSSPEGRANEEIVFWHSFLAGDDELGKKRADFGSFMEDFANIKLKIDVSQ